MIYLSYTLAVLAIVAGLHTILWRFRHYRSPGRQLPEAVDAWEKLDDNLTLFWVNGKLSCEIAEEYGCPSPGEQWESQRREVPELDAKRTSARGKVDALVTAHVARHRSLRWRFRLILLLVAASVAANRGLFGDFQWAGLGAVILAVGLTSIATGLLEESAARKVIDRLGSEAEDFERRAESAKGTADLYGDLPCDKGSDPSGSNAFKYRQSDELRRMYSIRSHALSQWRVALLAPSTGCNSLLLAFLLVPIGGCIWLCAGLF